MLIHKPVLNLYNTASRSKEALTVNDNTVKMYACGPTVYNYVHIGNFKTFIVEDILRRTLRFFGYNLLHVMNITDVGHLSDDGDHGEDKILKSAREQKRSVWEIAEHFTSVFLDDSTRLNIERPEVICKATDHIAEMIEMITILYDKGYAYSAGGNVYFDVGKFPDYGKMAHLSFKDEKTRVGHDSEKRDPRDFVLWFTQSKFENHAMTWDSPWGRGYPGWHIECSAMSRTYLGDQFDIHCGGTDLIPVHHSNEIAQSEALSAKHPWVRFWFHSAFLLLNRSKMSRSSGTFLTLSTLEEMGYHALDYRYFVLGANYRTQLNFSDESMAAARTARKKLNDFMLSLRASEDASKGTSVTGTSESANGGTGGDISKNTSISAAGNDVLRAFGNALADDLNTPKALAELWALVKNGSIAPSEKKTIIRTMDTVLGLNLGTNEESGQDSPELDESVQHLIDKRNEARKARNFSLADEIRSKLAADGILLVDSPDGTHWKKNV